VVVHFAAIVGMSVLLCVCLMPASRLLCLKLQSLSFVG